MTHKEIVEPPRNAELYAQYGYSAAVKSGDFLFISGQVGIEEDRSISPDPARQIETAFKNTVAILQAEGLTFDDVVDMTTFHVGLQSHVEALAAVKSRFVHPPYPAWTAIGVAELAIAGLIIEIKVVARLK